MLIKKIILFILLFLTHLVTKGEENNTIFWRGRVVNGDTGEPVPNAVVAVYSKNTLYSADIDGLVRLRLQKDDSVRVVVLGYIPETFHIEKLKPDSTGYATMKIYHASYQLKEVTVKGYRGFLDPHFFPKFEDDEPKVEMNLGDIGSKMSDLPPNEQPIGEPSVLMAITSPMLYIYTRFSKEQKQIRELSRVKYREKNENKLNNYISSDAIATITGFEGDELQNFIVYCNEHLKFNHKDNGASITVKIEAILEKYQKDSTQQNKKHKKAQ